MSEIVHETIKGSLIMPSFPGDAESVYHSVSLLRLGLLWGKLVTKIGSQMAGSVKSRICGPVKR